MLHEIFHSYSTEAWKQFFWKWNHKKNSILDAVIQRKWFTKIEDNYRNEKQYYQYVNQPMNVAKIYTELK